MKQPMTVRQSIRTDKFGCVTVLGSQYRDQNGVLHWYFPVLSEQNNNIRIHHVSGGELPTHIDSADREALMEAIDLWESPPGPQPNQTTKQWFLLFPRSVKRFRLVPESRLGP